METILKLWRGEIGEEEISDSAVREKIKGKTLDEKTIKEAETFSQELSEEQRKLFLSFWQVECEEWSAEIDEAFINGFKVGARLMKEILED